jgi:hypothetical protein
VTSIMENTTVLCPACKTRMSIRRIAHTTAEEIDEFIYHCPMCDIETKQLGPHFSKAPLESAASTLNDPMSGR